MTDTLLLRQKDLALLLGMSRVTVRNWLRRGLLPPGFAVGSSRVRWWRRADVERALAAMARKAS